MEIRYALADGGLNASMNAWILPENRGKKSGPAAREAAYEMKPQLTNSGRYRFSPRPRSISYHVSYVRRKTPGPLAASGQWASLIAL